MNLRLLRTSGSGVRVAETAVALLSAGQEVLDTGTNGLSVDGVDSTVTIRGIRSITGFDETIDSIRVTLRNRLLDGADGSLNSEARGLHAGNVLRLHFVAGAASPDGPHELRTLANVPAQTRINTGATAFQTFTFDTPVNATAVKLISASGFGGSWNFNPTLSGTIESQLLLSDGTSITLDDAYSPSQHAAPPSSENRVNLSHSLLLDNAARLRNRGLSFTGWRWRVLTNGTGSLTATPPALTGFRFMYEPFPESDLLAQEALVPSSTHTAIPLSVGWTVINGGPDPTWVNAWIDRVVLSDSPNFAAGNERTLGEVPFVNGPLSFGDAYTGALEIDLLSADLGQRYVFIQLDRDDLVVETNDANNLLGPFPLTVNTPPDLQITALDVPTNGIAGQPLAVNWTVTNAGGHTAAGPSVDRLYLSMDLELGNGDDILLTPGGVPFNGPLGPGGSYPGANAPLLPEVEGDFWIVLEIDADTAVPEGDGESNNIAVSDAPVHVEFQRPDLIVTMIDAPTNGVEGQLVPVSWTVRNGGNADALGSWIDRVYLSDDAAVGGDTLLANFSTNGPLAPGAEYTKTRIIGLPAGQTGPHYFIIVTDATNTVSEPGGEGNNAAIDDRAIDIQPTPRPDLATSNVVAPLVALADEIIQVQWTVTNVGNATAPPIWLDTVSLNSNGVEVPIGSQPRLTPLPGGQGYTATLQAAVPGRLEGAYEVCVTADSLDDVNESGDPANNTACAPTSITITQPPRPNLVVTEIDTPPPGLVGQPIDLRFVVANSGDAPATGTWFDSVVAVDTATLHGTVLAQSIPHVGPLDAGATYEVTQVAPPPMYPLIAGEYRLQVVLDRTDTVNEGQSGDEDDNLALDDGTFTVGSYVVSVQAGLDAAVAGTPVPLSGQATLPSSGTPVVDAAVAISVSVRGTVRTITKHPNGLPIRTDAAGQFQTEFRPLPTEAGHYYLTAGPPQNIDPVVQDEFVLYGMSADPVSAAVTVAPVGPAASESVALRNLGDAPLSGLGVTVENAPAGIAVQVDLDTNGIGPLDSVTLDYTVSADAQATGHASSRLRFTSGEGAVAMHAVNVAVRPPQPQLALVSPSPVTSAMLRNLPPPSPGEPEIPRQTHVEFRVKNVGGAATGPLTVLLPPNTPWMRTSTPESIAPIAPDGTATVALILSPAFDQPLGDYTGQIVVSGAGVGVAVPFRFTAVSDAVGDLRVIAEDELTYWGTNGYLDGQGPQVSDATVTLRDATSNGFVAGGQTRGSGDVLFTGLTEAYYNVEVRSPDHGTYRAQVLVPGGRTTELRAFLPLGTVSYSWDVVPTEIEDRYDITLDVVFETNVPAPVIRVEPAFVDLATFTSEYTQIDFDVTNEGLITADDVSIGFSGNTRFEIIALVTDLGDMPAHARYTVPVVIHDREFGGRGSGGTCGASGAANWSLVCGSRRHYAAGIHFNDPQQCGGGSGGGEPSPGGPCCNGSGGPGDPYSNPPSFDTPQQCCASNNTRRTEDPCCSPPCGDCQQCGLFGQCVNCADICRECPSIPGESCGAGRCHPDCQDCDGRGNCISIVGNIPCGACSLCRNGTCESQCPVCWVCSGEACDFAPQGTFCQLQAMGGPLDGRCTGSGECCRNAYCIGSTMECLGPGALCNGHHVPCRRCRDGSCSQETTYCNDRCCASPDDVCLVTGCCNPSLVCGEVCCEHPSVCVDGACQ